MCEHRKKPKQFTYVFLPVLTGRGRKCGKGEDLKSFIVPSLSCPTIQLTFIIKAQHVPSPPKKQLIFLPPWHILSLKGMVTTTHWHFNQTSLHIVIWFVSILCANLALKLFKDKILNHSCGFFPIVPSTIPRTEDTQQIFEKSINSTAGSHTVSCWACFFLCVFSFSE